MTTRMTITQYANLTGVKRDTIHKRIKNETKLKGVTKMEQIGSVYILHVDEVKAVEAEPAQ